MKTLQSNLSIWALATLLAGGSLTACAQATTGTTAAAATTASDPAKTTLLTPLQQSITKIKKLVATGDPDFDYSFQAKLHAQGVQDLLKQEIQNGKDTALIKIAKTLLPATDADVTLLDGTMRQLKPTRPNQAYTQAQSRNVEAMSLKLQQTGTSDKLTSNLDKNFSTLLLDQRQDAIDMATTYLKYGNNATLKTYAQGLIDKSTQQIAQIKATIK
ncbi:DUF305 domain-containing protein [Spirosoma sp. HMF4905]|uniref:DUF305 domain-containing protein n=1 Tax=Spirosoma arboris TaxID=2682092 RepID=A0A7K1SPZ5_9BACT|nr:DUF305 domain-containing protein [Spirosoma arboris]MVM35847.1 DUF305 domain-containing protein [Spirosoma arboris]